MADRHLVRSCSRAGLSSGGGSNVSYNVAVRFVEHDAQAANDEAHSLYHTFVGIVDEDREEDLRQCIVCRYSEG